MTGSATRAKVGVLALTLELYETLAPGTREDRENWLRREIIPALEKQADVLFDRAVYRTADVHSAVEKIEAGGADALVVIFLTYSPSQVALPGLQRARIPIVIWNTQELYDCDAQIQPIALRNNQGVHGTQDLANVLLRARVPFHYVTSHLRDTDGLEELRDFFQAAAAVKRLRQSRLGLLGYPFPGMGDFALDTTHLVSTLGCSWTAVPMEKLLKRAEAAASEDVAKTVSEYKSFFAVAQDITSVELEQTARMEVGLRGILAEEQLQGITYQFMAFGDDERTPTLPFAAISRLMAEGVGFGGEGDLISTAVTYFLNQLHPPATFSEVFTVDWQGNALFMSHMGEANVGMARRDRKVALLARPTPITRTKFRQLTPITTLEPGPATLVTLALGPENRWRFITAPVRIEDFGPLPGFFVPHFKIKPEGDVRRFLTSYAEAGGPHHNAVCFGDARQKIRLAAKILGAEYHAL